MSKRCVIVAEKEDEEVEVSVRKRIYQGKIWDFYQIGSPRNNQCLNDGIWYDDAREPLRGSCERENDTGALALS